MSLVLIDTGVIVALLDRDEWAHDICSEILEKLSPPLYTCEPVITESCYLLRRMPKAIDKLFANLDQGIFKIAFNLQRSASQVQNIFNKYADTPADFADACLIQMADELGTGDILTLDSDFAHYRWRRTRKFNLLVPLGRGR